LLTNTAASIGEGHLNARVPASRFSYISLFENSFNRMAAQIEKLVADNKILARSMSHDIRTPMSCLRFGVEAAIDTKDIIKKDLYLARMETELTRMEDMTTAFLEYAGMERQGFHLKHELVDIDHFLQGINSDFQSLAEQHSIELKYRASKTFINQKITLSLDFHWCYRAIQNLLSNAMQYAHSTVLISAYCQQNYLHISVKDDGKGIPEENIKNIFAPFVKLDVDRSRELGHFGLGLAISAKVVHWHNGTIQANNILASDVKHDSKKSKLINNKPAIIGACFTISLPLQAEKI
jgi:signal transduction histidine kinase